MTFSSITNAIRHRLINDSSVSALVGSRVYPERLPQNPAFPAIIITLMTDGPDRDDISGNAGLFRAMVQLDSYALQLLAAQQLDEKVRLSLQGYKGTHLDVSVRGIYLINSMTGFQDEAKDYKMISRFGIWYNRENPEN